MKIKLLVDIACPEISAKNGDTIDLTERTAMGLVAGGYAIIAKENKEKVIEEINVTKINIDTKPIKKVGGKKCQY